MKLSQTREQAESLGVNVPQDYLHTIEEAAEYLRTTVSTLRYWQQLGKGPKSFKISVRRLYRQSELDRFIAEAEATA